MNGTDSDITANNNRSDNESNHNSVHEMQIKLSDPQIQQKEFHFQDIMTFIKTGIEAIVDDEVTKRFAAEGILLLISSENSHSIRKILVEDKGRGGKSL